MSSGARIRKKLEDLESSYAEVHDFMNTMQGEASAVKSLIYATNLAPDGILNSEVTKEEAWAFSILTSMNDNKHPETSYDCPFLARLPRTYLEFMISCGREGRKEVVRADRGEDPERSTGERVREFFFGGGGVG